MKKGLKMTKPPKAELLATIATLTARIQELETELGRTHEIPTAPVLAVQDGEFTATDTIEDARSSSHDIFGFFDNTNYFTRQARVD